MLTWATNDLITSSKPLFRPESVSMIGPPAIVAPFAPVPPVNVTTLDPPTFDLCLVDAMAMHSITVSDSV